MEATSRRLYAQRRLELCVKVCRELYKAVHGREASIEYRKTVCEAGMKDPTLTFGEIVPQSFLQILAYTMKGSDKQHKKFVDLGSGTGRACMCAGLSPFGFEVVIGVELMPALCEQSERVLTNLNDMIKNAGRTYVPRAPAAPTVSAKTVPGNLYDTAHGLLKELEQGASEVQIDYFANMLTKKLGHKAFKAAMKEHKSFSRFLAGRPDLFTVRTDGKTLLTTPTPDPSTVLGADENNIEQRIAENMENLELGEAGCSADAPPDNTDSCDQTANRSEQDCGNSGTTTTTSPTVSTATLPTTNTHPTSNTNMNSTFGLTTQEAALLTPLPTITFHCCDMFAFDWSDADVIYAASLLFSTDMMTQLTLGASKLRSGAWVISLKPLLIEECEERMEKGLVLRTAEWYKMSWQMAKVYIYQVL